MIEIIPAINVNSFEELNRKIKLIEPFARWAQIDVEDGKFISRKTWNNPVDLIRLETPLDLEIHLMVYDLEEILENWLATAAERIIFHFEAMKGNDRDKDIFRLINLIYGAGKSVGIAINPETEWEELKPFIYNIDEVLVMGVNPGASGQKFKKEILPKIKSLRRIHPNIIIGVDGGVNLENIGEIASAGVERIYSGNYIFDSGNIKQAIDDLRSMALKQMSRVKPPT